MSGWEKPNVGSAENPVPDGHAESFSAEKGQIRQIQPTDNGKWLFISDSDIDSWETTNGGATWPDDANEVHIVKSGNIVHEFESLTENSLLDLESADSKRAAYGVQKADSGVNWGWGADWSVDDKFRLQPKGRLLGNIDYMVIDRDGSRVGLTAAATPPGVLEDFDRTRDPIIIYTAGDTDKYETETSTVREGSQSIVAEGNGVQITSDNLATQRGKEYRGWVYVEGNDSRIGGDKVGYRLLGQSDDRIPNSFFFNISTANDSMEIRREDDFTTLASASPTLSKDIWYQFRMKLMFGGNLEFGLYEEGDSEVNTITATDSTGWDVGNFNVGANGNFSDSADNAYYDYIVERPI